MSSELSRSAATLAFSIHLPRASRPGSPPLLVQVRRNVVLGTTAGLELRRLTEENEHLVARLLKMEEDLKWVACVFCGGGFMCPRSL